MSVLTIASTFSRGGEWLKEGARIIGDFVEGIREGREIANRYFELSQLSDAALAERGLSREQIPQVAVFGRPIR